MMANAKILKTTAKLLLIAFFVSLFSPFAVPSAAQEKPKKPVVEVSAPGVIPVIEKPGFQTYKGTLGREGVKSEDKGREALKNNAREFKDSVDPKKQYNSIKNSFGNLSGSSKDEVKDQKTQPKTSSKDATDQGKKGLSKAGGNVAAYNWQSEAGDAVVEGNFGPQDIRESRALIGGADITNRNQFNAGAMWKANGHAKFNRDGALVDMGGGIHGFVGVRNTNTTTIKSAAGTTTATVTTAAGAEGGAVGKLYAGEKGLEVSADVGGRIGTWVDASVAHNFEVDGQSVGGISFNGGAGAGLAAGLSGGFAMRTDKVGLSFGVALGPLKGGFSFYVNPVAIKSVIEKRLPPKMREAFGRAAQTLGAVRGRFEEMARNGAMLAQDLVKDPGKTLVRVGMSVQYLALKKAAEAAANLRTIGNAVYRGVSSHPAGKAVTSAVNSVANNAASAVKPAVGIIQRIVGAAQGAFNAVKGFFKF